MAEIRTRALVLRCYDQRESDRLVQLYTEDAGRVAAIAKGALRSKRRFPGTLEILTTLDVRLVDPPRAQLMRLESARVLRPFEGLVSDLGRYAIACQLVELLGRLTGEREPNPELFAFATGVLEVLRGERADRLLALLVLTKTISHLGYRPQLSSCASCGVEIVPAAQGTGFEPRHGGAVCADCREAEGFPVPARLLLGLETGIRTRLDERGSLRLGADDVRRLELLMDRFFRFHVGVELRSTAFLRGTLALERLDGRTAPGDNAPAPDRGEGVGAARPRPQHEPRARP